ncbi:MAG: LytR C-terminal domain-containing protein [Actinomycetota bacterium]|nr:LytR C-terminal domain-containing protein [Actinomycetota bacterium]
MLTPLGRSQGRRERPRGRGTRRRDPARIRALVLFLALVIGGVVAVFFIVRAADTKKPPGATGPTGCPSASASAAPLARNAVHVRVLNATSRTGLAASVAAELRRRGYTVTGVGNDATPVTGVAQLRYGAAGAAAVRALLPQLPGTTTQRDSRKAADIDLVLGDKFVALAPAVGPSAASCSPSAAPGRSPSKPGTSPSKH